MAKAKKAPAQSSGDQGEEAVLRYLTQQNRPYSVIDIFNNLHGAVGKTALTKVLQNLVDREEVSTKAYGKQSVFVVRQDNLPTPSSAELDSFDEQLKATKEELVAEREKTKTLQSTLSGLHNSLTSVEMAVRIETLTTENTKMLKKLEELRTGGRKVDPVEKAAVDTDHAKISKVAKARKKLCNEVIGTLCESMSKKPKDLIEELGLEVDPA